MAKFSSAYKQTAATRRITMGENTFEKGMHWSDQVIGTGYVHTLLNFEIDPVSYKLKTTNSYQVTDLAAGCTFLDRAFFGDPSSKQITVLQPRNEYCLRAFEGITNILSAQKIMLKSNQTLEEQLYQYGYTYENVVSYKLLIYNPVNYRLMCVTLLQAKRDKYFTLDDKYQLRRLNVNPISCGFSEIWQNDGQPYLTNCLNYHPGGSKDVHIPRIIYDVHNETFGQKLHHDLYMRTINHCEGYGNKTFCFTHRRISDVEGTVRDSSMYAPEDCICYDSFKVEFSGNAAVGDKLIWHSITDDGALDGNTLIPPSCIVTRVRGSNYMSARGAYVGPVEEFIVLSGGTFKKDVAIEGLLFRLSAYGVVHSGTTSYTDEVTPYVGDIPIDFRDSTYTSKQVYPFNAGTYLAYVNTGSSEHVDSKLNGVTVPVEAYKYGIALTSCALVNRITANYIESVSGVIVAETDKLWSTEVSDLLKHYTLNPVATVDLDTGVLSPYYNSDIAFDGDLRFCVLPAIGRDSNSKSADTGTLINYPFQVLNLFDSNKVSLRLGGGSVHPSDLLREDLLKNLRIGQGFRFLARCQALPPTRVINTSRSSLVERYHEPLISTFVLNYTWNGTSWDFSFVDTEVPMYDDQGQELKLLEEWSADGYDKIGNKILVPHINTNCLSYLAPLDENNIQDMVQHTVDNYSADKIVLISSGQVLSVPISLQQSLTESISKGLDNTLVDNASKLNDTSYGHFIITPKELTPSEATRWGYNMLSSTPYRFLCLNTPGLATAVLTGILLMDNTGQKPLLNPILNMPGRLFLYYNADFAYLKSSKEPHLQLKIETKNLYDAEWKTLALYSPKETHDLFATGDPITLSFTGSDDNVLVWATVVDTTQYSEEPDGTKVYLVVSRQQISLAYTKTPNRNNVSPEIYDLGTSTGMCSWKGRLIVWGVEKADNILFTSEPNEPEYFAYPNGVDIFEEPIIHAIPYGDALVVFTSTKLWRIDMAADGLSWNKTLLQQNLRIDRLDIPYIIILKNMLFFKSDKQFYMLVPSAGSVSGTLTIAPISKAIRDFLEDPFTELNELLVGILPTLKGTYQTPITEYLVKYGSHIEQHSVIIDWWFDMRAWLNQEKHYGSTDVVHDVIPNPDPTKPSTPLDNQFWLVQLIYDTQSYSWTLQTHTTSNIGVFISDAANRNTEFVALTYTKPLQIGSTEPLKEQSTWGISIARRTGAEEESLNNFNLANNGNSTNGLVTHFPRFQVLDTGYKELSSPSLKKRLRELQIGFSPKDNSQPLVVTLSASLDGYEVLSASKQILEAEDKINEQGVKYKEFKVVDSVSFIELPELTGAGLGDNFVLDKALLEGVKQVKLRKQISGKGYLTKFCFANITPAEYTITDYAFVYHNKNSR